MERAAPRGDPRLSRVDADPGSAEWTLPKSKNKVNRTVYFYKGNGLTIDDKAIPTYHSVQLISTNVNTIYILTYVIYCLKTKYTS